MDTVHADLAMQICYHNLSYLLLAQRILNHCEKTALFRLGIDKRTGERLCQLTLPELVYLAKRPEMVAIFRLSGHYQIDILLNQSRIHASDNIRQSDELS